ncbi:receptor-like protein EIX2 [Magnolia sinica]|uniref:receptor-like protein EIX2 n=1 Tax=Magnolia sinica TaxID=86752 RepID=UPI0026598CCC|nr:receptor-like protein EIX2 [Magnolia sinica]
MNHQVDSLFALPGRCCDPPPCPTSGLNGSGIALSLQNSPSSCGGLFTMRYPSILGFKRKASPWPLVVDVVCKRKQRANGWLSSGRESSSTVFDLSSFQAIRILHKPAHDGLALGRDQCQLATGRCWKSSKAEIGVLSYSVSGCLDSERKALTSFRKSLNDSFNILSSWNDDASDCCNWRGITCHSITGFVLKLDLHVNDSRLGLGGRIDPALVQLKHLQFLDLSYNAFNGIPIPEFLGLMKKLRHLNLSHAGFSGRIPHQLGNLSHLISLQLSPNNYHSLSAKDLWWLTDLPSLKYLDMSGVDLSMASDDWVHVMNKFPSLLELGLSSCGLSYIYPTLASVNFTSLRVLDLKFNYFKSTIPNWIANISSLVFLDLSGNQLNGNIPAALGGFSSLEEIRLSENQLNGTIPTTLGQLFNLYLLDLSYNSLTGNVSESVFENLKKLAYLYLSSNSLVFHPQSDWAPPFQLSRIVLGSCHLGPRFPLWLRTQKYVWILDLSNTTISGIIPTWFWDLTPQLLSLNLANNQIFGQLPNPFKMKRQAMYIDLSSNNFSGPIPCILNGARVLDLSNNQFSGPIPPNFTSTMQYLEFFSAKRNQISGMIPSSIEGMNSLIVLDLSQNDIGGIIPLSLGNCVALEALDFSQNSLSGGIPTSLGLLSQLQTIHLSNNTVSGKIPSSLKKCTSLETLNLACNDFSGHIPTWIGESFPALRILSLRSNMFFGNIPSQLSKLTSLQVLDVAQNSLSGSIPQSFENLMAMKNEQKINQVLSYGGVGSSYYKENLLVSVKGQLLEYTRTVSLVTCMDLSRNNLFGEIPEGLTGLLGLRALNLSGNHLTGKIPDKIGKLALLESLDFSVNQLSGAIPLSMSNLTFLSCLNLSFNYLLGEIPSGNQLQTFQDPSIYMGNNGLCGPPLLDKCVSDETPPGLGDVKKDKEEDEMHWFYSGLGPGFAVGFWALCGILVLKRSWRIVSGCLDSERKALTTFRKSLNDSFNILSSWNDEASDCCKWRGITCDNITGSVLKLYLQGNLGGRIDPALVQLKHLQLLDLSSNDFNGAQIPDFLGSMKEFRDLDLSWAGFSGRIPRQLGNLAKLISLKLSSSSLSAKNLWWLTSLPLNCLDMSRVNLSVARHDWVHVMNNSPSLVELHLFDCGLSYISPTLPSVNFTSLRVLDLSYNNFNSSFP